MDQRRKSLWLCVWVTVCVWSDYDRGVGLYIQSWWLTFQRIVLLSRTIYIAWNSSTVVILVVDPWQNWDQGLVGRSESREQGTWRGETVGDTSIISTMYQSSQNDTQKFPDNDRWKVSQSWHSPTVTLYQSLRDTTHTVTHTHTQSLTHTINSFFAGPFYAVSIPSLSL